jgi:chorismate dehydratase
MRIGAVSYLNTKPLVYGLAELTPQAELIFDLPSRLADQLAAGVLDVALIPSIEYFQNDEYAIVSDACIGCRGPVMSVKLLSRVPLDKIRTLALDEGSRTSVALVRILLQERYGLAPRLLPFPLGVSPDRIAADAILMIGDRAMHPPAGFVEEWDLGDQWCRWAELPFVFAMWVARRASLPRLGEVELALCQARDQGIANLTEIVSREAAGVGLSPERCLSYLRDNLHFVLGPRERRGLELFHEHAIRLGLAPKSGAGTLPSQKSHREITPV